MKKMLYILSIFLLIGCGSKSIVEQEEERKVELLEIQRHGQEIMDSSVEVTRDGCQYFLHTDSYWKGGILAYTHKGNCNNPIHIVK